MSIIKSSQATTLLNCPVGIFAYVNNGKNVYGLKTEYIDDFGQPKAYELETGQYFWGDVNIKDRPSLVVYPCKLS
jgi:hypothetical protein